MKGIIMTPEQKTQVIYEDIREIIPQIKVIKKWSTKKSQFYNFIELSMGNDYKKLIILQDIEKLLIDTIQTKTEHKKVEGSFLEDDFEK